MARFEFDIRSQASPEAIRAALLDFSERRPELWPGLPADQYAVYEVGDTWAEIREGYRGPIWWRERYDWSMPRRIQWTAVDSGFGTPGSYVVAVIEPAEGGGSRLHITWDRRGKTVFGTLRRPDGADPRLRHLSLIRNGPHPDRGHPGPSRLRGRSMTRGLRAADLLALTICLVGCEGTVSESPSPSPALVARGNFVTNVREVVELEASGEGFSVTGRMTVSEQDYAFTVDLQCTRTTEDGLVMIGGITTDTAGGGSALSPVGPWAGIVLQRGSPVGASTWSQRGGPTSQAASCLAFLHEQDMWERSTHPGPAGDWTDPIEGTVELGP